MTRPNPERNKLRQGKHSTAFGFAVAVLFEGLHTCFVHCGQLAHLLFLQRHIRLGATKRNKVITTGTRLRPRQPPTASDSPDDTVAANGSDRLTSLAATNGATRRVANTLASSKLSAPTVPIFHCSGVRFSRSRIHAKTCETMGRKRFWHRWSYKGAWHPGYRPILMRFRPNAEGAPTTNPRPKSRAVPHRMRCIKISTTEITDLRRRL